ncbi:hypothetical protein RLEG3_31450 [Rhizobium leguminosarum bv. trifolii WSM1689]|nr:hypothetical protein RLEG3_31450 [Rhizobium leguminosarum bv. trifolii WSM1689]
MVGVWLADEFSAALDRFAEQEVDAYAPRGYP